jgi:hypothetical protein
MTSAEREGMMLAFTARRKVGPRFLGSLADRHQ